MLSTINIRHGAWGNTAYVPKLAWCLGQYAVHRAFGFDAWTVTHIKSGARLASYSKLHVAVNLAKEFHRQVDCDWLYDNHDTPEAKLLIDHLRKRRQHVDYREHPADVDNYRVIRG